ncbi:peptidase, S8A subfamily [Mortierella sp. GBAus27b]|nr:peptidase, S8A subfamily [Mortierella sp. GBAus27b]
MKFTILVAAVIALVQAAPLINNGGKPIADSYIAKRQNGRGRKPTIHRKFQKVPGFAATVNQAALKELLAADEVEFVEQDSIISISGSQSSPPSWGLTRISQRTRNLSAPYLYNDAAGEGVTAYVVDTGIYVDHSEFEGRASWGADFTGEGQDDGNGHGTHVAGTIGGVNYGVAKKVNLVAVRVLGSDGSGATSGVVSGMDWVAQNANGKSVVNMSLGGSKSSAINSAAQRLVAAGVPLIVAAGNSNTDACNDSPSGASSAFGVAASDSSDRKASFSSWGSCVKIFAPGVSITSSWIGSADATNTISGTSMATPHVVGVAALLQSYQSFANPQALYNALISTSTPNKITGTLNGSPNRLLFNSAV